MRWLDLVKRDPVPWLLDPENPSARYLTLQHIFKKTEETLAAERTRVLQWEPVQDLLQHWNRFNFWGRVYDPYFGSEVSNFGTLHLLGQMAVPRFPELEPVCENLLDIGRHGDGRFSPEDARAAPWLCYTGMALKALHHFGYDEDLRVQSARAALIQSIVLQPELLDCPMVGGSCRSGLVKALDALLSIPADRRTAEDEDAVGILAEQLLNDAYDWEGRDADWLLPTFPRYYDSDVVELCHVLSQTPSRTHHRFEELVQHMVSLQTNQGRWRKMRATPALSVERIYHPSRWLTYEAVHTLMSVYGDSVYAA